MKNLIFIFLVTWIKFLPAQTAQKFLYDGNVYYQNKNYGQAKIAYEKAWEKDSTNFLIGYNFGLLSYQMGAIDRSIVLLQRASGLTKDRSLLAKAYYNLGVVYVNARRLDEGIEAFKSAIKIDPDDDLSRDNLQIALNSLKGQSERNQNGDNKETDIKQSSVEKKKILQDLKKTTKKASQNDGQILNSVQKMENALRSRTLRAKKKAVVGAAKDW